MNNSTLLEVEIQDQFEHLRKTEFGSEQYKIGVDGLTKLIDRSIEIDRLSHEFKKERENQKLDTEFKEKQMAEDKKSERIRNGIAIGGVVLPLLVTIWGTRASLKFEETGTVTTIMGRGFINKLLPKK